MAPAANTARARKVPGALADSDSDLEFHAYNSRLKEASAARARLRKAQDARDKKRAALTTAHSAAIATIESRIQASLTKHAALRSAISLTHLKRLRAALDSRDAKLALIVRNLAEHQRRMLNLAVQLQALYEGRREDVGALRAAAEEGKPEARTGGGRVDRELAERVSVVGGKGE
ncbi:hypothetical protein BT67DRAFT_407018 [Trichocladium antarcticum]|uniref:Uncharacterized protein n=1 Tax=Trichocladium antarcticum TaxID=1450529 RepID=A0AAN6ZC32_9PEZI|nr:hypothetical protein BT67DRAFT_407018 [Trichocladium antarcticum]